MGMVERAVIDPKTIRMGTMADPIFLPPRPSSMALLLGIIIIRMRNPMRDAANASSTVRERISTRPITPEPA